MSAAGNVRSVERPSWHRACAWVGADHAELTPPMCGKWTTRSPARAWPSDGEPRPRSWSRGRADHGAAGWVATLRLFGADALPPRRGRPRGGVRGSPPPQPRTDATAGARAHHHVAWCAAISCCAGRDPLVDPAPGAVDPARGPVDPAARGVDPALGSIDPAREAVDPAARGINPTLGPVDPTGRRVDPAARGIDPSVVRDPGHRESSSV